MNVILIDDDAAFRRSAEILLGGEGYDVRCFAEPAPAEPLLTGGAPVDVLILDYLLPGATGIDFLRRVRARLPRACRVLLISGHTDHIEPLDLAALGVEAFLPKPLDYEAFRALVGPPTNNGALQSLL